MTLLVLLAQISSPIGEGVCVSLSGALPSLGQSVEGIGGYCSLSGCTITGPVSIWLNGNTLKLGTSVLGSRGICFDPPGCTVVLAYSTSSGNWSLGGSAGQVLSTNVAWQSPRVNITGSAAPGVAFSGTAWLDMVGGTQAALQAFVPTGGGFDYDTTNSRWRAFEGVGSVTGWNMLPSFNPDGGTPYGAISILSGYNALGVAGTDVPVQHRIYPIVRPLRVDFTSEVAGVGVGTFTLEVFDVTSSVTLCTKSGVNCTAAAGTVTGGDCAPYTATTAVGHDIALRMTCGTCTTCPLGNIAASFQSMQ